MIIKSQSQIKDDEYGLYLVSTPIGNLKDITLRAIETLKKSSYILCEDTRVSRILLDKYQIKSHLISNHKFNESKNLNKIIDLLKSGEIISLISDAGTPSISDPGAILVNECVKNIGLFILLFSINFFMVLNWEVELIPAEITFFGRSNVLFVNDKKVISLISSK